MSTTTFKKYVSEHKVEIPAIQRDYVQGRGGTQKEINKREKFVEFLINNLSDSKSSIHLQFIYGSTMKNRQDAINSHESFTPLDGQQRLTTLFLLHWILWTYSNPYVKENYSLEYLSKFAYKTRISSSTFCERLAQELFDSSNNKISIEISQQPWFSENWKYDPTITAMLQMLDSIQTRIKKLDNVKIGEMYKRLVDADAITFDLLDMDKFGLTDSLYIKMNARGKQLTEFENWKSDFIGYLESHFENELYPFIESEREIFATYKEYFSYSIEHEWTTLFWKYYCKEYMEINNDSEKEKFYPSIDKYFMNFFEFLQTYFYYTDGKKHDKADFDTLDVNIKTTISRESKNIIFLFQSLDALSRIGNHTKFFDDLFFITEKSIPDQKFLKSNRVRLFSAKRTNIFETICSKEDSSDVKDKIMLIALLKYFIKFQITQVDDTLRIYSRCIRNLIEIQTQSTNKKTTCESEIRINDFIKYDKAIEEILNLQITTPIFFPEKLSISHAMLETSKKEYITTDDIISYHELEDNRLWYTHLEALSNAIKTHGITNVAKAMKAFCEASDLVKKRILIACGYKGITLSNYMNGERLFYGSKGRWDVIFITDRNVLKPILSEYVKRFLKQNNIQSIIQDELNKKTSFDFTYYMLKYDDFADANGGSSHFWTDSDLDQLNLIAFNSYKGNPALAYHVDPFVNAVISALKENDKECYKLYTGKCPLRLISAKNKVYFEMLSTSNGWKILFPSLDKLPASAFIDFNIQESILKDLPGKDRIETAIEFISKYKTELSN